MLEDVERLTCKRCGQNARGRPQRCAHCEDGGALRFHYDLERIRDRVDPRSWSRRESWLWRYRELLPFDEDFEPPPLQVGLTPLYGSPRLAQRAGVRGLMVKDESRQVGGDVFDRAGALVIAGAQKRPAVSASLAPWTAPYAASNQTALLALATSDDAARLCHRYGAEVVRIELDPDQALARATKSGRYLADWPNPLAFEGLKTLGLELGEQLAERLPDWIVVDGAVPDLAEAVREGLRLCKELGFFRLAPQVLEVETGLDPTECVRAAEEMTRALGLPIASGRELVGLQQAVARGDVEREAVALVVASGRLPSPSGPEGWPGSESVQSFEALEAHLASRGNGE